MIDIKARQYHSEVKLSPLVPQTVWNAEELSVYIYTSLNVTIRTAPYLVFILKRAPNKSKNDAWITNELVS